MQRTKRPARNIRAQGDLDSACFLYCLANAAFLLTGKLVKPPKWADAISMMPVRADDFLSNEGTGRIGDHPESLQKLADSFMKGLKVSVQAEVIRDVSSSRKLARSISSDQVVILGINGNEHWVVAVETSGSEVYYACSAQALNDQAPYREDASPDFRRLYNASAPFSKLDVWESFAIVLKRSAEE